MRPGAAIHRHAAGPPPVPFLGVLERNPAGPCAAKGLDVDEVGRRPSRSPLPLLPGVKGLVEMGLRRRVLQALANGLEAEAGALPVITRRQSNPWLLNLATAPLRNPMVLS